MKARPFATLAEVSGRVILTRGGISGTGKPGQLLVGDTIETGEASSALIRFSDGTTIELSADAFVELQEGEGGLVLKVTKGLIVSRVSSQPTEGPTVVLTVLTPSGLVRVGRAEARVDVGTDETRVDVKAGELEVVSRNGQSAKIGAGENTTMTPVSSGRTVTLEPVQVVLLPSGRVEIKKSGTKVWAPASARNPPALSEGDAVRVRDGSATLRPKDSGSRLSLSRGAEMLMGPTQVASNTEDLALQLTKGTLTTFAPAGKVLRLRAGGGIALVAHEGAQFSLSKTKDGFDLNAVAGDVVVEREGSTPSTVLGGQAAAVTASTVTSREVPREAVSLPSRGSVRLLHPGIGQVAVGWPGEDGKDYRVTVGSTADLSSPAIEGVVHQNYFNVPVPNRGTVYWRVKEGTTEVARGSIQCAPEVRSGELGRLRNEVPDGPEKTVIFYQDKPPSVTFTWKPDDTPGVAGYRVQVYREGDLARPFEEHDVTEPTLQLPENALGEGRYLWSTAPLDATGKVLKGGRMNKLDMVYDNAVPGLIIKSPRNGDPWRARVPVVGVVPVGARVSANGKVLPLDEKGRFDTTVAPLPGGRVVFRTVMESGEVFTVRVLKRSG